MLLVFTPQGRAIAQDILRFFVRVPEGTITVPVLGSGLEAVEPGVVELPLGSPTQESGCGSLLAPRCTLDEVRLQVTFQVHVLDESRAGMDMIGATVTEEGALFIVYRSEAGRLGLAQVPSRQDNPRRWLIGPSTTVEPVMIGDVPGEYVRGGWFGLGIPEAGTLSWSDQAALQTLRWEDGGIQYTLWFESARTVGGRPEIDRGTLLDLATALGQPSGHEGVQEPQGITVQQAAEQAGFNVTEPAVLPPGFIFLEVVYASQNNAVCLLYQHHSSPGIPSAVLVESNWALPPVSDLQPRAMYGDQPIEIAIDAQSTPVLGAEGGTGTLVTTGLQPHVICGTDTIHANRALFWQADGKNYALFASLDQHDGRGYMTPREMRLLAEHLNGIPSPSASGPDPERLLSIKDAEALTGLDLRSPALMVANLYLDHISINSPGPYQGSENETLVFHFYRGQPVGDGRAYHLLAIQVFDPKSTLEDLSLAGDYQPVRIQGQPAIYRQDCWDNASIGGRSECRQHLAWDTDRVRYEIEVYLPASLTEEMLIEIAESMR
jgi:hypothetical protein